MAIEQNLRAFNWGRLLCEQPQSVFNSAGLNSKKSEIMSIDKYVDKGLLIDKREISVYQDDSLIDLFLRLQDLELKMMIEYLDKLRDGKQIKYKKLGEGKRYRSVPWEIEKNLFKKFQIYKNNY